MRPLVELDTTGARAVFTDVDDTLTFADGDKHGLVPEAFSAIAQLKEAGFIVVPVTGRPAGWAEMLAATWPVDAVVAENGAIAIVPEPVSGRRPFLRRIFFNSAPPDRMQLDATRDAILAKFPFAKLAGDQWLRICDLAFDIGETQSLATSQVDQMASFAESLGARHTRSTVHLHISFSDHDKAKMLLALSRDRFALHAPTSECIFVGDSENDQAGFSQFSLSVGVANVRKFEAVLRPPPAFVTSLAGGLGFAQLAAHLLRAK